jgi:hypothetical protein
VRVTPELSHGFSPFKDLGHFGQQDQTIYGAADLSPRKWDLNLGVDPGTAAIALAWC